MTFKTKKEFMEYFSNEDGTWNAEKYAEHEAQKDKVRIDRVNKELAKHGMAYKVSDSEGNTFVYEGLEPGIGCVLTAYRGMRGSKIISGMTGLTVIQQYAE